MVNRFVIGVALIITSLIIGKLNLLVFLIDPLNLPLQIGNGLIYLTTWVVLFVGIFFCGREGYERAKSHYAEYQKKTAHHIKRHTKRAVSKFKRPSKLQKKK